MRSLFLADGNSKGKSGLIHLLVSIITNTRFPEINIGKGPRKERRKISDAERAALITAKGNIRAAKIIRNATIIAAMIGLLIAAINNVDKFYTPTAASSSGARFYDVSFLHRVVGGTLSGLSCLLLLLLLLSPFERTGRKNTDAYLAA